MLISYGHKSFWANQKECKIQVNGSFIQIYFKQDGIDKSITVLIDDLKKLLDGEHKHGESVVGMVGLVECADLETLMNESTERIKFWIEEDRKNNRK